MLNRDSERATVALKNIKELTKNDNIKHISCDLSSFNSVNKAIE